MSESPIKFFNSLLRLRRPSSVRHPFLLVPGYVEDIFVVVEHGPKLIFGQNTEWSGKNLSCRLSNNFPSIEEYLGTAFVHRE